MFPRLLVAGVCLLPLIGVTVPRFLAYMPPALALLALPFYYYRFRHFPPVSRWVVRAGAAVMFLMLASALWAVDPDMALERTWKSLPIVAGGIALFALLRAPELETADFFRRWFPAGLLAAGVVCALQLYLYEPYSYQILDEPVSEEAFNLSLFNRSVVVFILCAAAGFTILKDMSWPEKSRKIIGRGLMICAAMLVLKTDSQSAQMAFFWGLFFYFVFPWRRPKAWLVLGALMITGILAAPFVAQFLFSIFADTLKDTLWFTSGYAAERLEIWDFVARRALESPLMGFGVEATRFFTDFDTAQIFHSASHVLHPHNFVLQIWIEFGVLGAALLSAGIVAMLSVIRRLPADMPRGVLAAFIAFLSVACTSYGLWQGWWLGAMFSLLAIAALSVRTIETQAG